MKVLFVIASLLTLQVSIGQVLLDADGPGDTYELITSVLAPGHNPIEVPDCNHEDFGDHIDELFDDELDSYVFRFHAHVTPDNDRCINFDRQRNEIKSYDKSPDNLLGVEKEKVVYKWKFKLAEGFQSSPNFTHLHQLKSVGGSLASMPMYTLTTRKSNPDRIELRYAETDKQVTLIQSNLAPFIGTWLEATETILYGTEGSYEIELKRLSDGETLLSYADASIINWRLGADFVRPKWGIYRSLLNAQDLRDEAVLFANFSIEETGGTATEESIDEENRLTITTNLSTKTFWISGLPSQPVSLRILSLDGKVLLKEATDSKSLSSIDASSLQSGIYVIHVSGESINYAKTILVMD